MYDKTTFLSGLAMGLCGKGNPTFEGSGKILYNGVELPDINSVWNKKTHPYAVIEYWAEREAYFFSFSAEPFVYYPFINIFKPALVNKNHTDYNMVKADGETAWKFIREESDIYLTLTSYQPFWCSIDIKKDDGTLYLAASEPVPVEDAFTKGYHVGAELRAKRRLPAAYLYNGVRLPNLPKWDKTVYPYAVVFYSPLFGIPQWALYACTEFIYRKVSSEYKVCCSAYKKWTSGGYGWSARSDVTEETYILTVGDSSVKWTNKDVLNEDGTVWFAASNPVPVYE